MKVVNRTFVIEPCSIDLNAAEMAWLDKVQKDMARALGDRLEQQLHRICVETTAFGRSRRLLFFVSCREAARALGVSWSEARRMMWSGEIILLR